LTQEIHQSVSADKLFVTAVKTLLIGSDGDELSVA
jgi:hypothetical protein